MMDRIIQSALLALSFLVATGASAAAKDDDGAQLRMRELRRLMQEAAAGVDSPESIQQQLAGLDESGPQGRSALDDLEANEQDPTGKLREKAFADAVRQLIPMSPRQVRKLREIYSESQAAAATTISDDAKPTSSTVLVDLSPQATPPIIRLGSGYITSVLFLDSSGQPWPIAAYSLGDPSSFNIQWDRKGNTMLIQSNTFFRNTNLAVMLRDLNVPVMITLLSGQGAIDYRVDMRIPGFGPQASFAEDRSGEASSDPILLNFLNDLPPARAKEVKVSGSGNFYCRAWMFNKELYVRTNLHIISPGWLSVISSMDGTRAYKMQYSPILLTTQSGSDQVLSLKLSSAE